MQGDKWSLILAEPSNQTALLVYSKTKGEGKVHPKAQAGEARVKKQRAYIKRGRVKKKRRIAFRT